MVIACPRATVVCVDGGTLPGSLPHYAKEALLVEPSRWYGSAMNRAELLAFLRRHRLCVQASVSSSGVPQAAVVGFAVSDTLEIVFDTIGTTRKMQNLRRNGHIALVVGWDEEQTAQIEGVSDEPKGADLDRLKQVYFAAWPECVDHQVWEDITYVRVKPTWARYSDFRPGGRIVELGDREQRTWTVTT
jgi:hypothetical protein